MNESLGNPIVTVIMPAYNRAHTLPGSIQSVIDQTYQNWELVIIDDRSMDKTKEVIEEYIKTDKRIKYLKNDYTQGPAGARNFGIDNSNGKYISFLDSDDFWLPNHLSESIQILLQEDIVFCSAKLFVKNGEETSPSPFVYDMKLLMNSVFSKKVDNYYIFNPSVCEIINVKYLYPYHISTIIIERDALKTVGNFDESLFGPEDSDLIFRISLKYGLCLIDEFHSIYVEGEDNIHSFNMANLHTNKDNLNKLNKNRLNHIRLYKKQKRLVKLNKHQFIDYKNVIHNKNYFLICLYKYLCNLNRRRNFALYVKMLINMVYFSILIPNYIFRQRAHAWSNLNRPRVYLEGLPRVNFDDVLSSKRLYSKKDAEDNLSSTQKNYWLYFERDIEYKIQNEKIILTNTRTGKKLIFKKIREQLEGIEDNNIIINFTELQNKKLLNFVRKIYKYDFGGMVDVANCDGNPVSLINPEKNFFFWV
jgi:glycosyltransferase involved in cell wall biosynthesis